MKEYIFKGLGAGNMDHESNDDLFLKIFFFSKNIFSDVEFFPESGWKEL